MTDYVHLQLPPVDGNEIIMTREGAIKLYEQLRGLSCIQQLSFNVEQLQAEAERDAYRCALMTVRTKLIDASLQTIFLPGELPKALRPAIDVIDKALAQPKRTRTLREAAKRLVEWKENGGIIMPLIEELRAALEQDADATTSKALRS